MRRRDWALFLGIILIASSLMMMPVKGRSRGGDDDVEEEEDDSLPVTDEEGDMHSHRRTEEVFEEDEEDAAGRSHHAGGMPPIYATGFFPEYRDNRLHVGGPISVMVGVANYANEWVNVSHIGAYFCHPNDPNYYLQNFSRRGYGVAVKPGEVQSFEYMFYPSPNLENMDLYFIADVVYQVPSTGLHYKATFFNSTIEIVERKIGFDFASLFSALMFFSVVAVVVVILVSVFSTGTTRAVKSVLRKTSLGSNQATAVNYNEYLPDHLHLNEKSKEKSQEKTSKKKKN